MGERRTDTGWVDFWDRVEHEREQRSLVADLGVSFDPELGWVPPDDLTPEGEQAFLRLTSDQSTGPREKILARRHERELRELSDRYTKLNARYWSVLIAFVLITLPLFVAWNR